MLTGGVGPREMKQLVRMELACAHFLLTQVCDEQYGSLQQTLAYSYRKVFQVDYQEQPRTVELAKLIQSIGKNAPQGICKGCTGTSMASSSEPNHMPSTP